MKNKDITKAANLQIYTKIYVHLQFSIQTVFRTLTFIQGSVQLLHSQGDQSRHKISERIWKINPSPLPHRQVIVHVINFTILKLTTFLIHST